MAGATRSRGSFKGDTGRFLNVTARTGHLQMGSTQLKIGFRMVECRRQPTG